MPRAEGCADNHGDYPKPDPITNIGESFFQIGLDIGSTTIKAVILDHTGNIIFSQYRRHFSEIRASAADLFLEMEPVARARPCRICLSGSAGIALAEELDCAFLQEVLACALAVEKKIPDSDILLELGGEDAKLTFLTGGLDQRMNETCAGGTGAFIDQMAAFLGTDAAGLDALALRGDTIYPIASRCGVFAKSDLLPLINEGCARENIALSIMQAVVSQTISGLAQGRPIKGKTVFLGGPLRFLQSLRDRFRASLPQVTKAIFPEDGHFFVAMGAALRGGAGDGCWFSIHKALKRLEKRGNNAGKKRLPALFTDINALTDFRQRHSPGNESGCALASHTGRAWLGIDCGSTTIKAALINEAGEIIYSAYAANKGNPLKIALKIMTEIYRLAHPDLKICGGCATGYGSALIAAALRLDFDEVETVAHFTAASFFDPNVSFILDIGGQDIKCMRARKGCIDKISLNEACSAGCGSFIENFAESLGLDLNTFIESALTARSPVDLGSRCTVFMNSRVKQAQKEGAGIGDIAAGLAYAVVRNAIFKVMKIADASELGDRVVVQGGVFQNDAILRALELDLGIQVTRPPTPGLMGAFGAALIAKKRSPKHGASILKRTEAQDFRADAKTSRCRGCANSCLLTVTTFQDGRKFISGNRCERMSANKTTRLPNICAWKCQRLFKYEPLPVNAAHRGVIGIPRALNMYENYPLWHTLFTKLGFRVELSSASSRNLYFAAFDTIPSQTVCYPAKLAHGHILDLARRGVKTIFFPCVQSEQNDADFRHGLRNCPVVMGYPGLLNLNMDILAEKGISLIDAYLPLDRDFLAQRLHALPLFNKIPLPEISAACESAFEEMASYRRDLARAGEKALEKLAGSPALILAGHPYHVDPEINHGIPELITSCGLGVLTEDAVAHLMPDAGSLRVIDQWAYHSRLYRAGAFTGTRQNLAVLQLISFGCGLDAVTSDQLNDIVCRGERLYAQIKIDEGGNPGPARIRIRSLLAALREQMEKAPTTAKSKGLAPADSYPVFSPAMRHTHTLLVPQMSPLHFQFAREIFAAEGYTAELLPRVSREAVETGLRHVHNDACYPAIMVVGQLLDEIKKGRRDPDKIALVISQSGGICRATNYIAFLRQALTRAGLGNVPIANFSTNIHAPGIRLTWKLIRGLIMAGHYGDALMRVIHRLRPYERDQGSVMELSRLWSAKMGATILAGSIIGFQRDMLGMIEDFDKLPLLKTKRKPRIGLVGEILLKYHPDANNNAASVIEEEGGEAMVTDIMNFILYGFYGSIFSQKYLNGGKMDSMIAKAGIAFLEQTRLCMRYGFGKNKKFRAPMRFREMRAKAAQFISTGYQAGEGWLLAAEMVDMLENGASGILCMQPFGCLPNHVAAKGIMRAIKERYPGATITCLDYDPGTTEVNQINRIKLMMRSGLGT